MYCSGYTRRFSAKKIFLAKKKIFFFGPKKKKFFFLGPTVGPQSPTVGLQSPSVGLQSPTDGPLSPSVGLRGSDCRTQGVSPLFTHSKHDRPHRAGFLPCFRIFCFLYLCGSPPVNRLGPRSAVAVVVSVVMFVCSTQVRRETLGLIGVCFSKVWLLFYSCGLPLNGSASPFTTKIGGNIQAVFFLLRKKKYSPSVPNVFPGQQRRKLSHGPHFTEAVHEPMVHFLSILPR